MCVCVCAYDIKNTCHAYFKYGWESASDKKYLKSNVYLVYVNRDRRGKTEVALQFTGGQQLSQK